MSKIQPTKIKKFLELLEKQPIALRVAKVFSIQGYNKEGVVAFIEQHKIQVSDLTLYSILDYLDEISRGEYNLDLIEDINF